VPQQLLYNFDILPVAPEQRRKGVAKCMPRHPLVDSQFPSYNNVIVHYSTQPGWLFPTLGSSAVGIPSADIGKGSGVRVSAKRERSPSIHLLLEF
jgi:hypothetical protein